MEAALHRLRIAGEPGPAVFLQGLRDGLAILVCLPGCILSKGIPVSRGEGSDDE
jgi:hypothetical protein